jgi:predicted enzyme related to lactoylglutathione lyase
MAGEGAVMVISYTFAGVVVADRDASAAWYERLLGRPATFLPNDAEAVWQLTPTSSVYIVAGAGRAGGGVVTLIVDDLAACLAELETRGITPGATEEIAGAGRKALITDPDGNTVSFVELIADGSGHQP